MSDSNAPLSIEVATRRNQIHLRLGQLQSCRLELLHIGMAILSALWLATVASSPNVCTRDKALAITAAGCCPSKRFVRWAKG